MIKPVKNTEKSCIIFRKESKKINCRQSRCEGKGAISVKTVNYNFIFY